MFTALPGNSNTADRWIIGEQAPTRRTAMTGVLFQPRRVSRSFRGPRRYRYGSTGFIRSVGNTCLEDLAELLCSRYNNLKVPGMTISDRLS